MAAALFIFSPLVADPDLWGHVRFGQDALLTHQVIRPDTYSYLTRGQAWINHEWLAEVVYALAYNGAGARGLIVLNSGLSLLIVALIYARLRRAGMGATGAVLLTIGASLVLRPAVLNIRPQVFTYLFFLLLLLLIDAYTADPGRLGEARFVAGVFLVLAGWANLHGGVLAGVAVLYLWGLTYLGEEVIRRRALAAGAVLPAGAGVPASSGNTGRAAARGVVLALVLAPAALLANPYGPSLPAFLLKTATVARPEIVEWHAARVTDLWGQYWLGAVLLTVAAVGFSRRPRRAALLVPLAAIALLPLSAVRHIPLVAVAAPVLAADHFAGAWERLLRRVPSSWRRSAGAPVGGLAAAGIGAALVVLAVPRLHDIGILPASSAYPVRAVAVLEAAGVGGNMATEFDWGEYVLWHVGPGIQVSVDGRRETVYPEAIYRENLDFMRGEGRWDRLVDRPETDLALVDRERPAYGLMRQKAGWALAYEDEVAALFVRAGAASQGLIAGVEPPAWPADGAGMAFPVE